MDRRARNKSVTCQRLKLAALRLVDARGLEHVTVEMIADAADVSPRTFFNYFPAKEDALLGPGAGAGAEVERFWADRPAGESPLRTLRAMVLDRTGTFSEHSEEMDLRMRVLAANPVLYGRFHAAFHEMERVISALVADRCGLDADTDLYPRLLAAAGGAAIRSSLDLWRAGGGRELADIVGEAFDLYAVGLDRPPADPRTTTLRAGTGTRRAPAGPPPPGAPAPSGGPALSAPAALVPPPHHALPDAPPGDTVPPVQTPPATAPRGVR